MYFRKGGLLQVPVGHLSGRLAVVLLAVVISVSFRSQEDWAKVYHGGPRSVAVERALSQEVHRRNLSDEAHGSIYHSRNIAKVCACQMKLLETTVALEPRSKSRRAQLSQQVYRLLVLAKELMVGDDCSSRPVLKTLEDAGYLLGYNFADNRVFDEARRQLGDSWLQPSQHRVTCAEEMAIMMAMRHRSALVREMKETGLDYLGWLRRMQPAFGNSHEFAFDKLGGHMEVARIAATEESASIPTVLWAWPRSLEGNQLWSHGVSFQADGQDTVWRITALVTGGCLSVGLLPDKPLRRSHAVAMLIKVFAGDGHDMMEVPLNKAQGFLVFSLKPGTHSATFARLADCVRLPPLPRARHQGGEQEVALAALFYSRPPPSGPTPSPPPSSHNFNPLKDLRDLQQIGLAANKYYRVHAPKFQEQYGLPAGSPGYLHSPMLASGQLHRRLRLEGLGTNPTTSLRGPPPPESLSGWRGEGEEGPPDLSLAQILNGRGGGESSPDFIDSPKLVAALLVVLAWPNSLQPPRHAQAIPLLWTLGRWLLYALRIAMLLRVARLWGCVSPHASWLLGAGLAVGWWGWDLRATWAPSQCVVPAQTLALTLCLLECTSLRCAAAAAVVPLPHSQPSFPLPCAPQCCGGGGGGGPWGVSNSFNPLHPSTTCLLRHAVLHACALRCDAATTQHTVMGGVEGSRGVPQLPAPPATPAVETALVGPPCGPLHHLPLLEAEPRLPALTPSLDPTRHSHVPPPFPQTCGSTLGGLRWGLPGSQGATPHPWQGLVWGRAGGRREGRGGAPANPALPVAVTVLRFRNGPRPQGRGQSIRAAAAAAVAATSQAAAIASAAAAAAAARRLSVGLSLVGQQGGTEWAGGLYGQGWRQQGAGSDRECGGQAGRGLHLASLVAPVGLPLFVWLRCLYRQDRHQGPLLTRSCPTPVWPTPD